MMKRPFASFEELEEFFSSLASPGIRPGLERIARLLERLGHPEKMFPAVHIVGTNGKGSTAAFSERILRESGYSTALYTSPHLESPAERLLIDGNPLTVEEWSECAFEVEEAMRGDPALVGDPPTFFEVVTATAFVLCARRRIDIAVVEAGLGGRLDATNLLGDVRLTLITSISMDHMEFLGDTLEAIATEKFAVMRRGVPAIFSGTPPVRVAQFRSTALALGALPGVLTELYLCESLLNTQKSLSYTYRALAGRRLLFGEECGSAFASHDICIHLETTLHGVYQVENSALAVSGALLLAPRFPRITLESIRKGVAAARWPGRFETIDDAPPLILDGGHNPGGVEKLVDSLSLLYPGKRIGVVYGCMKDKAYTECLGLLRKVCSKLYCVPVPGNPRAASPELLARTACDAGWRADAVLHFSDPLEALHAARLSEEVVVCCGSLYLIGYVKTRFPFSGKEERR